MMLGFGVYNTVIFNFMTETLHIRPESLGIVEAVRESPGLLCFLLAGLTMRIAEPMLGSIALLLMSAGMVAYVGVDNVTSLMICSFVWSVGLHTWMPLQSSIVLGLAGKTERGKRLGQTAAAGSIGAVTGMVVVMLLGNALTYSQWFIIGASGVFIAALVLMTLRRDISNVEKPRFVWKRNYWVYYVLSMLEGGRKQVFMTFAIYALTREYHTNLKHIAVLMVINSIVNIFEGPIIGKMIDKVGAKKILTVSYAGLVIVFAGYAMAQNVMVLYVLYCVDNLFYISGDCMTIYLHKIAAPEDLMPTLSVGVTLNHIAAVLVPLVGGVLWARFGYPAAFIGGAVMVAVSLVLTAVKLPAHKIVREAKA
jgi:MFS family permease